jgi:hypothetical protein
MRRTIPPSSFRIALTITEEGKCRVAKISGRVQVLDYLLTKHNTTMSISK